MIFSGPLGILSLGKKIMNPDLRSSMQQTDFRRIEKALEYMNEHGLEQVSFRDAARHVHMSEYHFHRTFTAWAGTTPTRFLRYLKKEYLKTVIDSRPLLDAAYTAGLSGPGRLHDLFVTYEAMTPGAYREKGTGLTVRFGFAPTPFGRCFAAVTSRGLLEFRFLEEGVGNAGAGGSAGGASPAEELRAEFPNAVFVEDPRAAVEVTEKVFGSWSMAGREKESAAGPGLHLLLRGTNFQIKVWEALLRIPFGALVSYGRVAEKVGKPDATRAVGSAAGKNHIAFIIPCHRVIRKIGTTGRYRWGIFRKQAMIGWEQARSFPFS
jgi:AraC family transcriptional regulator, regulatory protein of adaptative response / methylated-DNA-[protein]-cysteine methyltransferase